MNAALARSKITHVKDLKAFGFVFVDEARRAHLAVKYTGLLCRKFEDATEIPRMTAERSAKRKPPGSGCYPGAFLAAK
jgi:hypothetical protein